MNRPENKESQSSDKAVTNTQLEVKMPSRKKRAVSCSSSSSTASSPPSDISTFSRQQRNLAEKQRRDKLNGYISELATLVPLVSHSSKKLDKTSVLRLTAAHLRLHQSSLNPRDGDSKVSWMPNNLSAENLNELLKAIQGFLVVTTISGKVLFSSKLVENFLGHQDIELIGHSIFYFIHPDDLSQVKTEWKKVTNFVNQKQVNGSDTNSLRSSFRGRMREKCQPRSEVVNYQLMRFTCSYTKEEHHVKPKPAATAHRNRLPVSELDNGILKLFIQTVNMNPFDDLSLSEAFQDEYVTQHVASGKIIFADHRISTITGHLPHEVIGMVAYEYIFREDVPVAQFAQKLMFSSSNGTGMIVYRLMSRDGNAVYLKSVGHLQYDKSSTKISHFVCINKLMSPKEGKEELRRFKERYSPRISELCGLTSEQLILMHTQNAVPSTDNRKRLNGIQALLSSSPGINKVETFRDFCNIDLPLQESDVLENSREMYSPDSTIIQDLDTPLAAASYQYSGTNNEWQNMEDSQMFTPSDGIRNVKFAANSLPSVSRHDNQDKIAQTVNLNVTVPHPRTDINNVRHLNGQKRAYNTLANKETCSELQLKTKYVKCANSDETNSRILNAFKIVESSCRTMYENSCSPIAENDVCFSTFSASGHGEPIDVYQNESLSHLIPIDGVFPLTDVTHLNGSNNRWQCSTSDVLKPDRKNGISFVQELRSTPVDAVIRAKGFYAPACPEAIERRPFLQDFFMHGCD